MAARPLHTFLFGLLRKGKTTAAASWPKPVFISAGNEGGDASLRFMNVDVIIVNSKEDLMQAMAYIQANYQKHGWRTVVFDSLTYYSDIFIAECSKNGTQMLQTRDWGMLDLHLQKWLLPLSRKLPLHFVWIANQEEIKDSNGGVVGGNPMLYGKTKVKFPGTSDLILQSITQTTRNQQGKLEVKYLFKTVATDDSPIGGRFGPAFAEGIIPAHFSEIAKRIGPWIGEPIETQKT